MGIRIPRISISADYGEDHALGDIGLLALGYGIHQAWIYSTMFGTNIIYGAPTIEVASTSLSVVWLISIIVYAACLIFSSIFDQRFLKFFVSRKVLIGAAIVTAISSSAIMGASFEGTLGLVSTIVGGVGTGLGSALLILFWGTAFARVEYASIVTNTAAALVVGIAIYSLILHQIPYPYSGVVATALPVIAGIFLWKKTPLPYSVRHEVPIFNPPPIKRGVFALKFCVPVLVFGIALGLLRETSIHDILPAPGLTDQLITILAAGIATVLILVTAFVVSQTDKWRNLFRPLIPFIAVAVFFLPFAGSGNIAADLVLLVAYMCFEALMWIFFGEISQAFRLSPVFVYGLGRGSMAIGSTLGSSFALNQALVDLLPFGEAGMVIVILLAMVVAYALLPRENDIQELMIEGAPENNPVVAEINTKAIEMLAQRELSGIDGGPAGESAAAEEIAKEGPVQGGWFRMRCEAVANHYLLSQRETEVLFLLAKGHNSAFVQEKLYISEGTAKTHMRHIYKKLNVHSQQELMRLVDKQELPEQQQRTPE